MGQAFSLLGAPDPRLNAHGAIDVRLTRLLQSMNRGDPPPARVKPLPAALLHHVHDMAATSTNAGAHAAADMATIAFFFLLRPGEYTSRAGDGHPFHLQDVTAYHDDRPLRWQLISDAELATTNFVTLTFDTQKNGVRGEVIGQSRSGHATLCPVAAMLRHLRHYRQHHSPLATPLASYYNVHGRLRPLHSRDIAAALKASAATHGAAHGLHPTDIHARSLRAGGAMALLCAHIDSDRIRLLGCWRSDEMFRYLTAQARPLSLNTARAMLTQGNFTLFPSPQAPSSCPTATRHAN